MTIDKIIDFCYRKIQEPIEIIKKIRNFNRVSGYPLPLIWQPMVVNGGHSLVDKEQI